MIEKEVVLFVRGEQYHDGVDPNDTELMTEGTMIIDDDGVITLSYQETELTGMEGTTTQFVVKGDVVELNRIGSVTSQMIFQLGRQHSSMYNTPWGALQVDINTSSLRHRINERGGLMEIQYSIAVEHQITGRNQFKIRVREKMR